MIGRLFALVVLATSALLIGAAPSPVAAQDQPATQDSGYEVTISRMDPVIPTAQDELTVRVVLRNRTAEPLTRVTMLLRVGSTVLTNSQDVINVASGDFRPRLPIVRYSTTSPVPAGEERSFTMQLPMAELRLSEPGVYPVAVEAVDVGQGSVAYTPTLLTWMPNGSWEESTRVAWLWPLAMPPSRAPNGLITDPALGGQFAEDGRLGALLTAASPFASQLSWVLDPQTQQTAAVMSQQHQVVGPRGPEDRPADENAARWVAALQSELAARSTDVSAMGYAFPDTTSLVAADLTSEVVLATTTAAAQVQEQTGRDVRTGFSWLPGGETTQESLNVLRGAGATTVVLNSSAVAVDAPGAVATLATDTGEITGVLGDAGLGLAMEYLEDPARGPIAGRQLLLAATATTTLNVPGDTMAIVPPVTWSPTAEAATTALTAATSAPWLRVVPLVDLLAESTADRPNANLFTSEVGAGTGLNETQTFGIALGSYVVSVLGQVTDQPSPALQTFRESLLRSGSAWWRDQPTAGEVQLAQTLAQVNEEQGKLAITTAGTITFPGDQGRVPVTISNDLDVPANVQLQLTSEPEYRLESEPIGELQIPAGQRVSLEVPVTVVGSQPVQVSAQLLTPQGLAYGTAEEFQLRSTAYSRVAQWVIVGALVLLAALVVRSVTARIRESKAESAADAAGDETTPSGDGATGDGTAAPQPGTQAAARDSGAQAGVDS